MVVTNLLQEMFRHHFEVIPKISFKGLLKYSLILDRVDMYIGTKQLFFNKRKNLVFLIKCEKSVKSLPDSGTQALRRPEHRFRLRLRAEASRLKK
jgi:hypothetical protein